MPSIRDFRVNNSGVEWERGAAGEGIIIRDTLPYGMVISCFHFEVLLQTN